MQALSPKKNIHCKSSLSPCRLEALYIPFKRKPQNPTPQGEEGPTPHTTGEGGPHPISGPFTFGGGGGGAAERLTIHCPAWSTSPQLAMPAHKSFKKWPPVICATGCCTVEMNTLRWHRRIQTVNGKLRHRASIICYRSRSRPDSGARGCRKYPIKS